MSVDTDRKRWWFAAHKPSGADIPYQVSCACGEVLRGRRRRQHQVVPCPKCGKGVFILPKSPLPPCDPASAPETGAPKAAAPARPAPRRKFWVGPAIAAVCSIVVVLAMFVALWPVLFPRAEEAASPEGLHREVEARARAGRAALTEGKFRLALGELEDAIRLRDQDPGAFTPARNRELNQLHRQANLLAQLLTRPLEEILQQGLRVPDDEEWRAQFEDYQGKTVLFDDVLRREDGRPVLTGYEVRSEGETARIALEDLRLFEEVPLDPPRRMLFGARLASCGREKGGVWVFRFAPDSGVLITDPDIAAACGLAPLDPELREVIERQQRWLKDLSDIPPAGR
jgi:hypothetical protein